MKNNSPIPVIDLFAGPGGLGEGFSALYDENDNQIFRVALSIEKEKFAHQTLELRSFFRHFPKKQIPDMYYQHLRGEVTRAKLFKEYKEQSEAAKREAWQATLGETPEEEIDKRISEGLNDEKNWLLIGGPPCQAYSLVGRARNQQSEGLDEKDDKVYLYREYYRILAKFSPPVFILENVKGLLSAKVKGKDELLFNQIINDLSDPVSAYKKLNNLNNTTFKCPGYDIFSLVKSIDDLNDQNCNLNSKDFVIKSEDYGIPQTRHRVILLGIRKGINIKPQILERTPSVNVEQMISDLPKIRSGLSKGNDNLELWKECIKELMHLKYFKKLENKTKLLITETIKKQKEVELNRGANFVKHNVDIKYETSWFKDENLAGVCNHYSKAHIVKDLYRYLYLACFTEIYSRTPVIKEFPHNLLPKHKNIKSNKFANRFMVQQRELPAKTITSHISKDGHYFIHYDPIQCRTFTVREAARIQTFPDNYFFCGPRTSQYIQVGNAVPPLLANKIANIVRQVFVTYIPSTSRNSST